MKFVRSLVIGAAATALAATTASAQMAEQAGVTRRPIGVATVNPFAVILAGFNGDVELVTAPGFTVALSGTYFGGDDDTWDYRSIDLTGRYYPSELAPRGFSIGFSVGYIDVEGDEILTSGGTTTERRENGPAIGFIGGYTWLLGRTDRLVIATGIGLKRAFVDDDDSDILPMGRLGLGLTF